MPKNRRTDDKTACEFIVRKSEPYCRIHRIDPHVCLSRLRT